MKNKLITFRATSEDRDKMDLNQALMSDKLGRFVNRTDSIKRSINMLYAKMKDDLRRD